MTIAEIEKETHSVTEKKVRHKYGKLTRKLISEGISITTMESCTSGQIASLITDTEGASGVFDGAFITYSNDAKIRQGVPAEIISKYGVYSAETASAMAEACRNAFHADIGIGITGSFSNKDPRNKDSIPGEVYFAISTENRTESFHCTLPALASRKEYKFMVRYHPTHDFQSCALDHSANSPCMVTSNDYSGYPVFVKIDFINPGNILFHNSFSLEISSVVRGRHMPEGRSPRETGPNPTLRRLTTL